MISGTYARSLVQVLALWIILKAQKIKNSPLNTYIPRSSMNFLI